MGKIKIEGSVRLIVDDLFEDAAEELIFCGLVHVGGLDDLQDGADFLAEGVRIRSGCRRQLLGVARCGEFLDAALDLFLRRFQNCGPDYRPDPEAFEAYAGIHTEQQFILSV